MSTLLIEDLHATREGVEILHGVDLEVRSGQVEAVMGPNGSGKSTLQHVLLGRPGYVVTRGRVTLDGDDLLALPTHERAARGLFAGLQYPIEVPGVSLPDVLVASLAASGAATSSDLGMALAEEAEAVGLAPALLDRPLNVDLSGGEKKRLETVQLALLRPKFALLDEIDSGLDVDALRDVSRRIEALARPGDGSPGIGVVAVTHYSRLLAELRPDRVHVFLAGRIVRSGGPELADELEQTGYEAIAAEVGLATTLAHVPEADPFADPGF
jgi:Fe-S cluster assembly ATP-binding protein